MKIVSALFDFMPYGDESTKELESYYSDNVDVTANPLGINVDFKNSLSTCYNHLQGVLSLGEDESDLTVLEGSYYKACQDYLKENNRRQKVNPKNWAVYTSRIVAAHRISDERVREVKSVYFSETKTMRNSWWQLNELEKKAFISIVTGDEPLSYFDEFVREWMSEGGNNITQEVRKANE